MPIEVEFIEEENTVIMNMIGLLTTEEITATIRTQLDDRMQDKPGEVLHAIYDVTEFEWTFEEFIKYIKSAPSASQGSDGKVQEHFVGTSRWVQQLRTWWKKRTGKETTAFSSMEDARQYIRNLQARKE